MLLQMMMIRAVVADGQVGMVVTMVACGSAVAAKWTDRSVIVNNNALQNASTASSPAIAGKPRDARC